MAMERYNGPGPAQRINDRLRNVPADRPMSANVTTQPTRTVTCVYPSGFQAQKGDQVKSEEK
jgi:hypothetical protein